MTMLSRNDQKGRSMVEMLGVLAIIGVLSVGGISGYSKAMAKFKLTKAQDQISMILMNVRTAYATSPSYSGLNSGNAVLYNIVPSEMISGTGSATTLYGAFGPVVLEALGESGRDASYFKIVLSGLGTDTCRSLLSSDWGSDGLVSINIAPDADDVSVSKDCENSVENTTWCSRDLPVSFQDAVTACSGERHTIGWVYY